MPSEKVRIKRLAYQASYRANHKEQIKIKNAKQYAKNRKNRLAFQSNYNANNKEKRRAYRIAHLEMYREIARKWRKNHPEKSRSKAKAWQKANPEAAKAIKQRRRARKLGVDGHFTGQEWKDLKKKYGNMCICCKQIEPDIKLAADHIIPIARGGNNYISNIQPLCQSCNSRKGVKTICYLTIPIEVSGKEISNAR